MKFIVTALYWKLISLMSSSSIMSIGFFPRASYPSSHVCSLTGTNPKTFTRAFFTNPIIQCGEPCSPLISFFSQCYRYRSKIQKHYCPVSYWSSCPLHRLFPQSKNAFRSLTLLKRNLPALYFPLNISVVFGPTIKNTYILTASSSTDFVLKVDHCKN